MGAGVTRSVIVVIYLASLANTLVLLCQWAAHSFKLSLNRRLRTIPDHKQNPTVVTVNSLITVTETDSPSNELPSVRSRDYIVYPLARELTSHTVGAPEHVRRFAVFSS